MSRWQQWLRINPETKPRIYCELYADAEMRNLTYWLGIVFSSGIATLGLVENSPAVIIGAMLISPLMNPIMATGLGLATGDLYLAIKALTKLLASIVLAVLFSALMVWLLPFHSTTPEILARVNPTLLDLGIALLSGLAGSVAVNRAGGGDGVTTLPGVAIAVALMPPLCTVGFGFGSGLRMDIITGAGLLFLTNIVAIVFTAFLLFLLAGMNTSTVRAGLVKLREAEPMSQRLSQGPFRKAFVDTGQLRWRVLLLVVLLGAIAFPLFKALRQLAGEAVARNVTQEVIHTLVPAQQLVSQQTEVGRDTIAVRLIATKVVPEDEQKQAEAEILKRSGRSANLSIESVASQSQLAQLVARMDSEAAPVTVAPPPPPPPAPKALTETGDALRERLSTVLAATWPAAVPVTDFALNFTATGPVLEVRSQSAKPLDALTVSLLQADLQKALDSPGLVLKSVREPLPKVAMKKRAVHRR